MGRRRHHGRSDVAPDEAARVVRALDRLEERLMMAPPGLHQVGAPASAEAGAAAGLPSAAAMLWTRFDGIEVGAEMARLLPLAEISSATAAAEAEGLLRPGDRVIGESGRDLLVLPADPYEDGADVVSVEETGERLPDASSAAHLALGLLGEAGVLFGDDGEFRAELYGEDGELLPAAERRLLRRRLDFDPDAPRPRLRLAQHLWRAGELRAAASELRQVLRRAPELPWAHETLGRVREAEGERSAACRAYLDAAGFMASVDHGLAAYFRARAARCTDDEAQREVIATQVREARPGFAAEQVGAAQALLEREAWREATEVIDLGLAVVPTHVELLALRARIAARGSESSSG